MAYLHRSAKFGALVAAVFATGTVFAQPTLAVWPGENGKIIFWQFSGSMLNPHAQIFSMESDGSNQINLSAAGGGASQLDIQPSVSPKGKRIAFTRVDAITFNTQIWTMKIDGSDQNNVSNDSATASESGPAWTEDGSSLLFVRQTSGSPPFGGFGSIWIRKANGTGTPRQLTTGPFDSNPVMSPDGDLIAFSRLDLSDPTGNPMDPFWRHLQVMKADGSGQLTDLGRGAKPDWSPDSRWIVYGQAGIGPIMVVKVSDPTQKHQIAGLFNEAPVWSPDGTHIVFIQCAGPMACEIAVMTATGQNPQAITKDVEQGRSDQKPDWQRANREGGEHR